MRGKKNEKRMKIEDFMVGDGMKEKNEGEKKGNFLRIGDMEKELGMKMSELRLYEDKGLMRKRREGVKRI